MKKLNTLFQVTTIMSLLTAGLFTFALAQNADVESNDQTLTIDIEVIENGEVRKITKEVNAADGENIHEILRELGVMEDIDISGTGERLEIKVKKEVNGDVDHDVDVEVIAPDNSFHWIEDEATKAKRPLLGVYIESYDSEGMKGANVTGIIEESAAESAGIKEGDVVTAIDGKVINSEKELRDRILEYNVGDEVEVTYMRNGVSTTKPVTLGEGKSDYNVFFNSPHGGKNQFFFKEEFEGDMEELMEGHFDKMDHFNFDFEFDAEGAFLGVTAGECTKGENGVLLGRVVKGSSAETMGLKAGDRVRSLNGKAVNSFDELADVISSMKPGDNLDVEFERNGSVQKAGGELGKREAATHIKRIMRMAPDCDMGQKGPWAPDVVKEVRVVIEMKDCTKEEEAMLEKPANVDFEEELPLNRIEFAPNPNDGLFSLEFELPEQKDTRILIFDQSGRKVFEELQSNFSGSYKNQIDISSQPNGVYFLIIAQDEKQFTKKIVKQ